MTDPTPRPTPYSELHKEALSILADVAALPLSAPVASVSDLRKRAAAAISRMFPSRAPGDAVQWHHEQPVLFQLPVTPVVTDDRLLKGWRTRLTLREDFATMDLGDGRVLQVCRGVASPHLFMEWRADDPKHPGLRLALDCSEVLSPLVQYAEGRPAGHFAALPIVSRRDDAVRYGEPVTPAAKEA